jgi:hypothetical protein
MKQIAADTRPASSFRGRLACVVWTEFFEDDEETSLISTSDHGEEGRGQVSGPSPDPSQLDALMPRTAFFCRQRAGDDLPQEVPSRGSALSSRQPAVSLPHSLLAGGTAVAATSPGAGSDFAPLVQLYEIDGSDIDGQLYEIDGLAAAHDQPPVYFQARGRSQGRLLAGPPGWASTYVPASELHVDHRQRQPRGARASGSPSSSWHMSAGRLTVGPLRPSQQPVPVEDLKDHMKQEWSFLPSRGAALHEIGLCTPCKFHRSRRGCKDGSQCTLCHHPHWELTYSGIRRVMKEHSQAR